MLRSVFPPSTLSACHDIPLPMPGTDPRSRGGARLRSSDAGALDLRGCATNYYISIRNCIRSYQFLATGVCVGSVTLELWVMRGTCSWSALLLQISETSTLPWLQSAQVSWLGLCGPETSLWSAGTSLLASIECHADDRQTLFHPFSLVGCQGCCKHSFPYQLCKVTVGGGSVSSAS